MRVLTVCLGNICRSPTAAAAIEEAALRRGLDVVVDSAGTSSYHLGEPPDRRMTAAAAETGLTLTGQGRRITPGDFAEYDLVLAMDRHNEAELRAVAPDEAARDKIHRFRQFDPAADRPGDAPDVPDPYFGGNEGFREVVEICRRTAEALVTAIADGEL